MEALVCVSVIPSTFLREKVRVLLHVEALVILVSVEASIVASQLGIFLNTVIKASKAGLFVRAPVVTCVVALVLLH